MQNSGTRITSSIKHLLFISLIAFNLGIAVSAYASDSDKPIEPSEIFVVGKETATDRLIWTLAVDGQKAINSRDGNLMYEVLQRTFGGLHIEQDLRTDVKFREIYELLLEKNLDVAQLKQGETARLNLVTLVKFWDGLSRGQRRSLLATYRMTYGTMIENAKHGVYELPREFGLFIGAIAADRIFHCFGGNVGKSLTWETSIRDPSCLYEIAQMLQMPSFWAGFSAFIVTSRITNVQLLQTFEKLHQKGFSWKPQQLQFMFSSFGLAAGFFADHMVRTLIDNENLSKCAASVFSSKTDPTVVDLKSKPLGEDSEGNKHFDFWSHYPQINCQKFRKEILSGQFWGQHTATPLASMLTSGLALSLGGFVGAYTVRLASQAAPALSMVTGVGGVAYRFAHLFLFFQLNHYFEPRFRKAFFNTFISPRSNGYRDKVLLNLQKAKAITLNLEDSKGSSNVAPVEIEGVTVDSEPIELDPAEGGILTDKVLTITVPKIQEDEICSFHYTGIADHPDFDICTRIPLLAHLASFHDYSKSWRTNRILGDYLMYMGRWKTKYDTYLMDYKSSMHHMQIFSRVLEIKLTGKSDAYDQYAEKLKANNLEKTLSKAAESLKEDKESLLARMQSKHQELLALRQDRSQEGAEKRRELLRSLDFEEILVVDELDTISQKMAEVDFYKQGQFYDGLSLKKEESSDHLVQRIRLLVGHPFFRYQSKLRPNFLNTELGLNLTQIGVPDSSIAVPHRPQNLIIWLLEQRDDRYRTMAFLLTRQILPYANLPDRSLPEFSEESPEELRQEILQALANYEPAFANEALYWLNGYAANKNRIKQPSENWNQTAYGFDTSNLSSFTTSQLICGRVSEGWSIFGAPVKEGLPAHFKHPHIAKDNICQWKYYSIHHKDAKNRFRGSVERSLFATPWGLHAGLFNAYINQPRENFRFQTERETAEWWNSEVRSRAREDLKKLEADYAQFNKSDLKPLLTGVDIAHGVLGLKPLPSKIEHGCGPYRMKRDISCHTKLNPAIAYEIGVYFQVLDKMLKNQPERIQAFHRDKREYSRCLVKMIASVSSKNYKDYKSKCFKSLNKLKNALLLEGENQNELTALRSMPESKMTPAQVRKRAIQLTFALMGALMEEISSYNDMYQGGYSLKLHDELFGGQL